jgi:hypothetical protein
VLAGSQARGRRQLAAKAGPDPEAVVAAILSAPGGAVCEKCHARFVPKEGSAGVFCPDCLPSRDDPPATVVSPSTKPVSLDTVEARDKALLACIDRNGGLALMSQLRGALPKGDPANADGTRDQAVKHALTRLKLKGILGRTGDTWSRVGIGMEASSN